MPHQFPLEFILINELTKGRDISTIGLGNHGTSDILARCVAINEFKKDPSKFKTSVIEFETHIEKVDNCSVHWYIAKNNEDLKSKVSLMADVGRFNTLGEASLQLKMNSSLGKIYEVHIFQSNRISLKNPRIKDFARNELETDGDSLYLTEKFVNLYGDHYISSIQKGAWYANEVTKDQSEFSFFSSILSRVLNLFKVSAEGSADYNSGANSSSLRVEGIAFQRQGNESTLQAFQRTVKTEECTALLSITLSAWTNLGLKLDALPAPIPSSDNMSEFNKLYLFAIELGRNADYNLQHHINYGKVAEELLEFAVDENNLSHQTKQNIETVFTSPLAFPLAHALRNIHTRGIAYIVRSQLLPQALKDIVQWTNAPRFISILPTIHEGNPGKVLMMDWTREGWVRLPCMFDFSPHENALWRFTPVDNGKYFLIDSKKWPEWYLFMRNDDAGRIMSWNHAEAHPDSIADPQSLWIVTPQKINNEIVFRLSTRKWPRCYIYVNNQGLEWIHGSFRIPEPRGLFYLRTHQESTHNVGGTERDPLIAPHIPKGIGSTVN